MRKNHNSFGKRMVSAVLYLFNILMVFYPWIVVGNIKYNFVQLMDKIKSVGIHEMVKQSGVFVDNPEFVAFSIKIQFAFYIIFLIICIFYIITVFINKNWKLNLVAFFAALGIAIINSTGYSMASVCTNQIQGMVFPVIHMVIIVFELIASKLFEVLKKK